MRLSGAIALVIAIGSYVLARVAGSRTLLLLVYGTIVVLIGSWLIGRRRPALEGERSELPRRVREGQSVEVTLKLGASRRVSTLILHEELGEHLGGDVRIPLPLVSARSSVEHSYTFIARKRGVYRVGPLVAMWSDPFGLTAHRTELIEPAEIIVHPTVERLHDRIVTREWEDPPIRPPFSKPWPSGFEFYGMREYVPGDDPRRIVWRAVARSGDDVAGLQYLVRESEQGITDRVSIILDTDRTRHTSGIASDTFETAIRLAASLGVHHLEDGFALTFEVNSRRLLDQLRGRGNRVRLLDEMAKLDVEDQTLSESIDRLVVQPRRDVHTVLIAPDLDEATGARLRVLVQRGVALTVALVQNEDADPIAVHRAASLGCTVVEIPAGASVARTFERVVAGGLRR
ncbi:MAG: DUF58 domain-containing protein [Actinomycetota bacterium]